MIWTVPNALSGLRLLCIPVIWWAIGRPDSGMFGLLLFSAVVATDWIDGFVARRFNQVSEVGKVLDPVADRLVIATGLVALCVRGAFPWWAAGLILLRDALVLIAGTTVMLRDRIRIDVRMVGKFATFALMTAVPCVSWGNLDLAGADLFSVIGWAAYTAGITTYYVAAVLYARDIRSAIKTQVGTVTSGPTGM